jgi:hypothetical protein
VSAPRKPRPRAALSCFLIKLACSLWVLLFVTGITRPAAAAQDSFDKNDPLTDAQVEQLREVADQPIERVKLFMAFIEQRTGAIAEMVGDTRIQDKPPKIRKLLEEYTYLVDQLQDNLDNYDKTHEDLRKQLKLLVPASRKWLDIVNQPPADPVYDFPRKTAADAAQSLIEQAAQLQTDQEKYFAEQKKQKKEQEKTGDVPNAQQP